MPPRGHPAPRGCPQAPCTPSAPPGHLPTPRCTLQRAMLRLLPPRPGEAGKGLRSLRGGGRGWGCSRDQALVSGFAISHSVLMWRVCLNNLTGRLINQALAFVCRLKAEIAIRRNTRSGTAFPPAGPSVPSPSPPCSLVPGSAALGSFINGGCANPAPQFPVCSRLCRLCRLQSQLELIASPQKAVPPSVSCGAEEVLRLPGLLSLFQTPCLERRAYPGIFPVDGWG